MFLSELLHMSVGSLFAASLYPGLLLSLLYLAYIGVFSLLVPSAAPKLASTGDPLTGREITQILVRGILPPVALISMVLGSILSGFVTITASAAVGAGGAMLLAVIRRKLALKIHDPGFCTKFIFTESRSGPDIGYSEIC